MKINPTKADRERWGKLRQLGCILCGKPPEIHHLTGAGMGLRSEHVQTIPLCFYHHRTGNHGFAIHAGEKTWEKRYGSQKELLEITNQLLEGIL